MNGVSLEAAATAARLLGHLSSARAELLLFGLYDEAAEINDMRKRLAKMDIRKLPDTGGWKNVDDQKEQDR